MTKKSTGPSAKSKAHPRRMQFVEHSGNTTFAVEHISLRHAEFKAERESGGPSEGQFETKARISNETVSLENDRHSVSLIVNITRLEDETEVFSCEVCYTGVFLIQGLSKEKSHELLMTRCLDMLYPYIGSTVAQLASQAGFQGLQLVPISFGALYRSEQREKQQWESIQDKVVRH